jgi:hypothetical protein
MIVLIVLSTSGAYAQYVNQTAEIYGNKEGNMYVTASYTSTNGSRSDRTIYLKSRNVESKSRDMLTWTNGGIGQVNNFVDQLITGMSYNKGASFQVNFLHRAVVVDRDNIKLFHKNGGFSYFNRAHILLLKAAINK